jgi:uncharacterized membrane protein
MGKIFNRQNVFNLVLSYLLSVLLFEIIFKKFDLLTYFTTNAASGFSQPWIILWLLTVFIFVIIYFFGRRNSWKKNLVLLIMVLIGINFYKVANWRLVGYFLNEIGVWQALIFSLTAVLVINLDKIKARVSARSFNIALNILIGLMLLAYFLIPIMNHLNYREAGLDMGIYDQALWKYAHFRGFSNSIDGFWGLKNILGDHFEIILMIISPIYWLKSSVITLHIFNGLVIMLGCYFLYLLGKLKLNGNKILSKLIVLIFLVYAGLQMAFMEGQFHPLSYVPILIILIVYFIEIKKWWAFWLSLLLMLAIKESMGLYAFFIGVYLIFTDRKYWKIALLAAGLGVAHYILTVKEVAILYGKPYRYFNYWRLGTTNGGVIKTLIINPIYALYVFLTPIGKIATLSLTLGSFGLLVFSSPLIIGIPMFAERFLSSDEQIWRFYMHYNAPLAGVLICALVFFIYQNYFVEHKTGIGKFVSNKISAFSLIIFVLIASLLININYRSDIIHFLYQYKSNFTVDQDSKDLNEISKIVPKDASVAMQNALVTHFTDRDYAYELPANRDAEYIVASSAKDDWPMSDEDFKKLLNEAVQNGGYGIRAIKNHAIVLQKNYHGEINAIPETFYYHTSL